MHSSVNDDWLIEYYFGDGQWKISRINIGIYRSIDEAIMRWVAVIGSDNVLKTESERYRIRNRQTKESFSCVIL